MVDLLLMVPDFDGSADPFRTKKLIYPARCANEAFVACVVAKNECRLERNKKNSARAAYTRTAGYPEQVMNA
jgi:hypothetical protein